MKFTSEQLAKAKQAKTAEELLALAKENGIEISEEAAKYFVELNKEGELSYDELDNVAGGFCEEDPEDTYDPHNDSKYVTHMKCANCGQWADWNGNYVDGVIYECGSCHVRAFIGISVSER